MSVREHKKQAGAVSAQQCAVLVISDTQTEATDESGKIAKQLLLQANHKVVLYKILKNNPRAVRQELEQCLKHATDFIITIGGTGVSHKDQTIEAIIPLLAKTLEGFGELFRTVSYQEIGTAALMSRALLGVMKGGKTLLLCTPGSPHAVRLALEKLMLPELPHLIWELHRYDNVV